MAQKVCIRCGQDCSDKPRTKDLQGNYTCRGCYEKLQAGGQTRDAAAPRGPRPAPVAPPVRAGQSAHDDAAVLAALLDGPESGAAESCPNCGSVLPAGGLICMICGYNKATGKQAATKKFAAPREKRERGGGGGGGVVLELLTSPWTIFIGLSLIYGGTFMAGVEDESAMLVFVVCYSVAVLATFIYEIVAAFSDGDSGWGICAICQIIPCAGIFCWLAMLYYVFVVSERGRLKAMLGSEIVGTILLVILQAQNPEFFRA